MGLQSPAVDASKTNTKEPLQMPKVPYLKAIGSLIYLMLGTRPDLTFATGK